MDSSSRVPPGFRFHPTDEELVDYYLRKKVASSKIDLDVIKDVDLYKIEPWDLQEKCKIGMEEQNEWYFFSHKDKKYPTGTRTNRATTTGFWKATGRDKPIYTKNCLVGMRKTLVFYRGRAPNGHNSDWIMHEYRLETSENATAPEEGWVVCRVCKKRVATVQRMSESPPCWFDDHSAGFMPALGSPRQLLQHHRNTSAAYVGQHQPLYHCKPELEYHHLLPSQEAFLPQLPQLESPNSKPPVYIGHGSGSSLQSSEHSRYTPQQQTMASAAYMAAVDDSATDWSVLDKFVASQLFSHGDSTSKEPSYSSPVPAFQLTESNNQEETQDLVDYASTSASGGDQADLWK